jgi:hypothetical protein
MIADAVNAGARLKPLHEPFAALDFLRQLTTFEAGKGCLSAMTANSGAIVYVTIGDHEVHPFSFKYLNK